MTTRDSGYKDINILKNTLRTIGKSDNLNMNNNNNDTSNNIVNNKKKINSKQCSVSRNKKVENYNNISMNKISRNDSLSKLGFLDVVNMKKRVIKGINIKNFSKVLNVNLSQSKIDIKKKEKK